MEFIRREQLLSNARWFFSQDVQLITFRRSTADKWYGAVMPASSSLRSVSTVGGNKDILLFVSGVDSLADLFRILLDKICHSIAEIYREGGDVFAVNGDKLQHNHIASDGERVTKAVDAPSQNAEAPRKLQKSISRLERKLENLEKAVENIGATQANTVNSMTTAEHTATQFNTMLQRMERTLEAIEMNINHNHSLRCDRIRHEQYDQTPRPLFPSQTNSENLQPHVAVPPHPRHHARSVRKPSVTSYQQYQYTCQPSQPPDDRYSQSTAFAAQGAMEEMLTPRVEGDFSESETPVTSDSGVGEPRSRTAAQGADNVGEAVDRILARLADRIGKGPNSEM